MKFVSGGRRCGRPFHHNPCHCKKISPSLSLSQESAWVCSSSTTVTARSSRCASLHPKQAAGASSAASSNTSKLFTTAPSVKLSKKSASAISIEGLLCVTDHLLPQESQHWVSPAYLGRVASGRAKNCEPRKTREVRWFPLDQLPLNLTMTARNAINAYTRQFPQSPNHLAR